MKKIQILTAILALAFVVVGSAFKSSTLKTYGLEAQATTQNYDGVNFTLYNVVDVTTVTGDNCNPAIGHICSVQFDDAEILGANNSSRADDTKFIVSTNPLVYALKTSDLTSLRTIVDNNGDFEHD